jgi:DNA-binding PadR family transcriptional regulator
LLGFSAAQTRRLPERFAFSDVCQALGYTPDRGSLYRALQELKDLGYIAVHSSGAGTQPTRYRQLVARNEESGA